jgi:hypothetical protein
LQFAIQKFPAIFSLSATKGEIAKFGVQECLIKAISLTQSDHTALLRDHTTQLRTINGRLEKAEGKLDLVHVGVEAIQILLKGPIANETHDDDPLIADPVDGGPDALP